MIKKFLSRFIRRNHYWRNIEFDELSELYTSMMFRSLAMSLVGIFIPVYLYQLDYMIWQILMFYAAAFFTLAFVAYPVARLIAKVGPKHTMLASYVGQVVVMMLLATLDDFNWSLAGVAIILGLSNCLFWMAFHVDFSKVKHSEHGGKELGWLYSMEKVGSILGPLVGGLLAYFIGAQFIFISAVVLLFIGIIPLFLTKEPLALNQKLDFNNLAVKDIKYDLTSQLSMNIDQVISLFIWPLFISIYIFSSSPYVLIGTITSASVLVSFFIVRAIGKTIDKNNGRWLLRYGASINALLHLFRPFANSFPSAVGINLVTEAVTPAFRMPSMKGLYDKADDLTGKRIVYISVIEAVTGLGKALFFLVFGLIAYAFSDGKSLFTAMFIVGAIASLGIMSERFKALNPRR